MKSILTLIDYVIWLYIWVLFAYLVLGILIQFGVVNAYNKAVNFVYEVLTRLCEPLLRPIRRVLKPLSIRAGGALDLSPLALFLLLWLLQMLLREYAWPLAAQTGP